MKNNSTLIIVAGFVFLSICVAVFGSNWQHYANAPYVNGRHMMQDGTMMDNDARGQMGMQDMMTDMTAALHGKTGKELEKAFIVEMIPHHQGAVDMAKILVTDPQVSEKMKQFGNAIITAQEGEIQDMQEWLKAY